jgi:hypothetical protein
MPPDRREEIQRRRQEIRRCKQQLRERLRELDSERDRVRAEFRAEVRPFSAGRIGRLVMSTPFQAVSGLALGSVPWVTLHGAPPSFSWLQAGGIGLGVVFFTVVVWLALVSTSMRGQWPSALIALQVVACVSFVEASFAGIYFAMSAHVPRSFEPFPVNRHGRSLFRDQHRHDNWHGRRSSSHWSCTAGCHSANAYQLVSGRHSDHDGDPAGVYSG